MKEEKRTKKYLTRVICFGREEERSAGNQRIGSFRKSWGWLYEQKKHEGGKRARTKGKETESSEGGRSTAAMEVNDGKIRGPQLNLHFLVVVQAHLGRKDARRYNF